jgi:hypothetical protein
MITVPQAASLVLALRLASFGGKYSSQYDKLSCSHSRGISDLSIPNGPWNFAYH